MQTGLLPAKNTVCEVDAKPFVGSVSALESMDPEDVELNEAIKVVGATYMDVRFGDRGPFGF